MGYKTLEEMKVIMSRLNGEKITQFDTWKIVKIGVYKNLNTLIKTMKQKELELTFMIKCILMRCSFKWTQTEENIPLCIATVKQITGNEQATTKEILDAVKLLGGLCFPEIVFALREQYIDQPNNEVLNVAAEPIDNTLGDQVIFIIGRSDDELWLRTRRASPKRIWDRDDYFVFRSFQVNSFELQ